MPLLPRSTAIVRQIPSTLPLFETLSIRIITKPPSIRCGVTARIVTTCNMFAIPVVKGRRMDSASVLASQLEYLSKPIKALCGWLAYPDDSYRWNILLWPLWAQEITRAIALWCIKFNTTKHDVWLITGMEILCPDAVHRQSPHSHVSPNSE